MIKGCCKPREGATENNGYEEEGHNKTEGSWSLLRSGTVQERWMVSREARIAAENPDCQHRSVHRKAWGEKVFFLSSAHPRGSKWTHLHGRQPLRSIGCIVAWDVTVSRAFFCFSWDSWPVVIRYRAAVIVRRPGQSS